MKTVIFLTSLLFAAALTADLFLKVPSVWPDEAIYADIAGNFIREGRLGTDLWQFTIPGVENHAFWYPPVFFSLLSGWFKLWGISIFSQRLFSLFAGLAVVALIYLLLKAAAGQPKFSWPILTVPTLLFFDPTFFKASHISRPEIFVLLFTLASLWFCLKAENSPKNGKVYLVLSIFLACLAFLTHLIGVFAIGSLFVYLFLIRRKDIFKIFPIFLITFFAPIAVWLMKVWPNLEILKAQVALAAAGKQMEELYLWTILSGHSQENALLYFLYIVISAVYFVFAAISADLKYKLIASALFFAWAAAIYGRMGWYLVLAVPFIYLSAGILLIESWRKYRFKKATPLLAVLFSLLLLFILQSYFGDNQKIYGVNYSYEKFTAEILNEVPDNKTVLLSSIPDPYFAFKASRHNRLFEFPVLPTSPDNYLKVLSQTDYIIFTGNYFSPIFGDLLPRYIELNKQRIVSVGSKEQYRALIIELKPYQERIMPK